MAVMIGIDPHKRSHTAVALGAADEVLGELRVTADNHQVQRLLSFASPWPDRVWAVENANGLGRLLSRQLVEAGEQVVDVPARLSAQVRALSGGGHKTDAHDARSTAVAGKRADRLRPVTAPDELELLGLLIERRWQVVSARQKTLVRIHEQLTHLMPGGWSGTLSISRISKILRRVKAVDPVDVQRREIVKELLGELRMLDRKRKALNGQLDRALDDYGTTLTQIAGIGRVGAATILATVGDITRFATAARFASYTGTAPIAASSGDRVRHRLNRGGKRQLNKVLHTAAVLQQRMEDHPGQIYVRRRIAEGKSRAEAIRALKRHLSNVVYRCLIADNDLRARGELGCPRRTNS